MPERVGRVVGRRPGGVGGDRGQVAVVGVRVRVRAVGGELILGVVQVRRRPRRQPVAVVVVGVVGGRGGPPGRGVRPGGEAAVLVVAERLRPRVGQPDRRLAGDLAGVVVAVGDPRDRAAVIGEGVAGQLVLAVVAERANIAGTVGDRRGLRQAVVGVAERAPGQRVGVGRLAVIAVVGVTCRARRIGAGRQLAVGGVGEAAAPASPVLPRFSPARSRSGSPSPPMARSSSQPRPRPGPGRTGGDGTPSPPRRRCRSPTSGRRGRRRRSSGRRRRATAPRRPGRRRCSWWWSCCPKDQSPWRA